MNVAELNCPLLVRVVGGRRSAIGEPVVPAEFLLRLADYTRPGRTLSINLSQSGDALLSLVQTQETPAGTPTCSSRPSTRQHAGFRRRAVGRQRDQRPRGDAVQVFLVAPRTGRRLSRRYPKETSAYPAAGLRRTGAGVVFAARPGGCDAGLPRQRPAHRRPGRSRGETAAGPVLRRLPPAGPGDRELRAIGEDALRVFLHTDRSGLSAEQNLRVEQVLVPWASCRRAKSSASAGPGVPARLPLFRDPPPGAAAAAALRKVISLDFPFDPDAAPGVPPPRSASCGGRCCRGSDGVAAGSDGVVEWLSD